MERTFTTVGHSVLNGTLKLRFTNDPNRQTVLERNGHEDIVLQPLPEDMTKEEAAQWIIDRKQFNAPVRALAMELLNKTDEAVAEQPQQRQRRGPGRPKGSKNRQAA